MSKYTKATYYEYTKVRRNFGRQPLFHDVPAHMLDSINPDKKEQKLYILRNPVHQQAQATMPQSEHETNTKQLVTHEAGINHSEGGWPREIQPSNEEHITRHRRRVMHEDNYVHTVFNLAPIMAHYVDQNNAINMYETYFSDMASQEPVEKYSIRVANIFRDTVHRPISCIAWTYDIKSKLVVSYCDRIYNPGLNSHQTNTCFVWDTSVQNEPAHTLYPSHPCWEMACAPTDPEVIVGGLENGTVCVFDLREGNKCVSSSSVYTSHREPITSMLYIHSRTNTEFFTGSTDGQCLWWDTRKLEEPINQLPMSVNIPAGQQPCLGNAESISCLEYDYGLPTKFLCGTDSGLVINVNRMGREHSDMLASYWNAHIGSVRSVQRSPCTKRMFLTCGDYRVQIWSEEVRMAPIIITKQYRYQVTQATWAPVRLSSYMAACAGGYFYYWDLLRKTNEPVATLQVSHNAITKIAAHSGGYFVAIGDVNGSATLVSFSENMVIPGNKDKQLMHHVYERNTRREHIIDARIKEIHLKQKVEDEAKDLEQTDKVEDEFDEEQLTQMAEEEYFKIVAQEMKKMEISAATNIA